jgi:glycosyltransferase involved in cell wall biosynthesis
MESKFQRKARMNPRGRGHLIGQITPLVITFNEAPNIARVLEKLRWARRIIIVDSGSTDETLDIVSRFPQAEVLHKPFDSFAEQCNFGLDHVETEWVLSLDADYELSEELVQELHQLQEASTVAGYRASFVYRVYGRSLRGTIYPPRTVLYRVRGARYANEGHGHRVSVPGEIRRLRGTIYHDDRKALSHWLVNQQRYARLEAEYLLNAPSETLHLRDRLRRLGWPLPLLVFFYTLLFKGCIRDGRAGWFYVLQRVLAETSIAVELVDRRLTDRSKRAAPGSWRRK